MLALDPHVLGANQALVLVERGDYDPVVLDRVREQLVKPVIDPLDLERLPEIASRIEQQLAVSALRRRSCSSCWRVREVSCHSRRSSGQSVSRIAIPPSAKRPPWSILPLSSRKSKYIYWHQRVDPCSHSMSGNRRPRPV